MEDGSTRAARVLLYAAVVCGGAVVFLLMFTRPSHAADPPEPPSGLARPVDAVRDADPVGAGGQVLAEGTRDVGEQAGRLVDAVASQSCVGREVTQRIGDRVTDVTESVAVATEAATADVESTVDAVAAELPEPSPPDPGPAPSHAQQPVPQVQVATHPSAVDADRRRHERATEDVRHPVASTGVSVDAVPAVPAVPAVLVDAFPAAPDTSVVGTTDGPDPFGDLFGPCAGCAAPGGSGSGQELPTMHALPPRQPAPPPAPAADASRRTSAPHALIVTTPDVSPD